MVRGRSKAAFHAEGMDVSSRSAERSDTTGMKAKVPEFEGVVEVQLTTANSPPARFDTNRITAKLLSDCADRIAWNRK